MDQFRILHGILLVSTWIVLTVAAFSMSCFILLFWDVSPNSSNTTLYPTCRTLFHIFKMRNVDDDDPNGRLSWRALQGLLVNGFVIPFLVLSCFMYLIKRNSQVYGLFPTCKLVSLRSLGKGGDPNIHFWTFVFVLLPCFVVTIVPQMVTPHIV